jgi:hypothetical protein
MRAEHAGTLGSGQDKLGRGQRKFWPQRRRVQWQRAHAGSQRAPPCRHTPQGGCQRPAGFPPPCCNMLPQAARSATARKHALPTVVLVAVAVRRRIRVLTRALMVQEDAGTGSTLLLSVAGALLDKSVRLVHEGCSLHGVVRSLRRVQEASRVLLDAAAIHIHQLITHATDSVPSPSGADCGSRSGARGAATESRHNKDKRELEEIDEFGWFDQYGVNDGGHGDMSSLPQHQDTPALHFDDSMSSGTPSTSAQDASTTASACTAPHDCIFSAGGTEEEGVQAGDGEVGEVKADGWEEKLGMGLAHGNDDAMRLAIHALAYLETPQWPTTGEPAPLSPNALSRHSPQGAQAGRLGGGRDMRTDCSPQMPAAKMYRRDTSQVETLLAPGLDSSSSLALPGVVVAVSEERLLLRRRLLDLHSRARDACGATAEAQQRQSHTHTHTHVVEWEEAVDSVRVVVAAKGAVHRAGLSAQKIGADVTTVISNCQQLTEYGMCVFGY